MSPQVTRVLLVCSIGSVAVLGTIGTTVAVSVITGTAASQPAAAEVPACTDAIADAHGICKGEPKASFSLTPCVTEDSDNCYWDAATMGNGEGRSFIAYHGRTFYLADAR